MPASSGKQTKDFDSARELAGCRAVAYARYSSEQQRAASIEDQLCNCYRRAADEGWTIVREFADKAISGADSSRPQYREMLNAAERGEFDILLMEDLSHLRAIRLRASARFAGSNFSAPGS